MIRSPSQSAHWATIGSRSLGDDATGGEQRGLRSTHYRSPVVKVAAIYSGAIMGSKPLFGLHDSRAGSRVALVAPAGPLLERDDLHRAEALCRALGYDPVLGENAGGRHGYLAGTDDERLADLNAGARATPPSMPFGAFAAATASPASWTGSTSPPSRAAQGADRLFRHYRPADRGHRATGVVTFHGPTARPSMPAFSRRHFERVLPSAEPAGRLGPPPRARRRCWCRAQPDRHHPRRRGRRAADGRQPVACCSA